MPPVKALFPLDGSDATYSAVEGGIKILKDHKDSQATFLVVVSKHLREMPEEAVEHLKYDDEDELIIRDDEAQAVLKRAVEIAKLQQFARVNGKVIAGKVYDAILEEAKSHSVLVMHRLSRDERKEKIRGGITEKLCRNVPCDVWLIQTG